MLARTRTCGLLIRSDRVDDQPGSSKVGRHLLVTHVYNTGLLCAIAPGLVPPA